MSTGGRSYVILARFARSSFLFPFPSDACHAGESGVVYNDKTISHHSLVIHKLIVISVLLDYFKYCFHFLDLLVYETSGY